MFPLLLKFGGFREFLGFSWIISGIDKFQEFFQDIWRFWRKCGKLRKKHIRFCFAPNCTINNIKMQKALTVGGGTPLSHTLPPCSLRSLGLGRFAPSQVIFTTPPLKLNPGYATSVCNLCLPYIFFFSFKRGKYITHNFFHRRLKPFVKFQIFCEIPGIFRVNFRIFDCEK